MEGVYGSEKLSEEAGVWEREGAALNVAREVEARPYRGLTGRSVPVSVISVADWNWRRYLAASDSIRSRSSPDAALSSEDTSDRLQDERFEGAVGERAATMS